MDGDRARAALSPPPDSSGLGAVLAVSDGDNDDRVARLPSNVAEWADGVELMATLGVPRARLTPSLDSLGRETLTARQTEVLALACQGLTAVEMGERLALSPKTVRSHLEVIYQKLNVPNRASACFIARRQGLIE